MAREDVLRRHGLEVFRVAGPDLAHPDRVVRRMVAARARARWEPESARRWTTEPPPWWEEGISLDEVLDRRDAMRMLHEESERAFGTLSGPVAVPNVHGGRRG